MSVDESRPVLSEAAVLEALAHPARLDLLTYLISERAATASACARAVGDTPSNCSYHLRVLARHGLVVPDASKDGRERPWRATLTGFDTDEETAPQLAAAVRAASLQLDQRLARDYLSRHDHGPAAWRAAATYSTYTLRTTPAELGDLIEKLDALIRPFITATRDDPPSGTELVHLGLHAFPRSWPR